MNCNGNSSVPYFGLFFFWSFFEMEGVKWKEKVSWAIELLVFGHLQIKLLYKSFTSL